MELLDPDERREIKELFTRWSRTNLGRIVTSNIDPLERFLPPEDLREILLSIPRAPGVDLVAVETAYRTACIRFVRRGDDIKPSPPPELVGRAVTRGALVDTLAMSLNDHQESAEKLVSKLLRGGPLEASERQIPMSRWAAWVTWDESGYRTDPFRFAAGRGPMHIFASLGLPFRRTAEELLLLVYRPCCRLLRPTIADAGLFPYFQPPYGGYEHGMTLPWHREMVAEDAPEPQPRPEAVHESQPLSCLVTLQRAS